MRRAKVVLVAIMTIPLAGCFLSGKPKTVAAAPAPPQTAAPTPPPEPLSIPQTRVDLPAPQPLNPDALATTPPVEPASQVQAKPPAPAPRPAHVAVPAPKTPDPPPPVEPEQPVRAPIQEVLSPDDQKQYKDKAHEYQANTHAALKGAKPHTANQKRQEQEITNFLKQSEQAENTGDLRLAVQLAERAYILAKELQSGK
jgi:hypothetical protein